MNVRQPRPHEKRNMVLMMEPDECEVHLCCVPVQNGNSGASRLLSYVASSSQRVCGNMWDKHWLVVFDYGENVVLVCHGDMDSSGELTGRKYWKKRAAVFKEAYTYKKLLGKYVIPKARIEEVMIEMCDPGLYHLTNNNCQTWAKDLLCRLDIEVPRDMPRDAKGVVNDIFLPTGKRVALLYGAWMVARFMGFKW